jgi:hypothetical protein
VEKLDIWNEASQELYKGIDDQTQKVKRHQGVMKKAMTKEDLKKRGYDEDFKSVENIMKETVDNLPLQAKKKWRLW